MIATGTHYLNICVDWEPTLRMLDLDEEVRADGLCAVVGTGAVPGVSTSPILLARSHHASVRIFETYALPGVDTVAARVVP
ncbi:hypothetical protein P6B95_02955 [Streptomyces atratus]|nr:hypothetical protein [Streptomyces atratus]WPW26505.1 hypothetical protein P6B95_02955 [Streptomyces atratus]